MIGPDEITVEIAFVIVRQTDFSLITPVQILTHCYRTNQRGKVLLDLLLRLDPHADPHGETSRRKQWNKDAATSSLLERKVPERLAVQRIDGSEAVGKDEVGSSNLPSSSTETRCPARDSGFLLFSVGKFAYAKPIQKPIPIKFDG